MRRRRLDFPDDANDLFQLVHQFGLVLQTAGGVDQQHVELLLFCRTQCVEGKARGIRALGSGDNRRFGAFAPNFQLLDRGRPKGVARGQHHLAALGGEFSCKLADGGGFSGTIDTDHENDERLLCVVYLERPRHRNKHLLDFGCDHRLHVIRRDRLVVTADADRGGNARCHLGSQIGAQQHVLDIVEHRAIELALGDEIGHRRPERARGALQAAGQPLPPAQFCRCGSGIIHAGCVSGFVP